MLHPHKSRAVWIALLAFFSAGFCRGSAAAQPIATGLTILAIIQHVERRDRGFGDAEMGTVVGGDGGGGQQDGLASLADQLHILAPDEGVSVELRGGGAAAGAR